MGQYSELCEWLWRSWLSRTVVASRALRARFDFEAAPEPYLLFDPGDRPLVIVTTNPGGTMPHQRWDQITTGRSILSMSMKYVDAADVLARYYVSNLTGPPLQRIAAQRDLAEEAGYSEVIRPHLGGKDRLAAVMTADPDLAEYTRALGLFLDKRCSVAISAISTRTDLGARDIHLSPWLTWQCQLLGIQPKRAIRIPLVRKGTRITAAALVDPAGSAAKVLVLMMGGNHLPSGKHREFLVNAIQ